MTIRRRARAAGPHVAKSLRDAFGRRLAQRERMQRAALDEISGERQVARRHLPFGFGGQPGVCPAREFQEWVFN